MEYEPIPEIEVVLVRDGLVEARLSMSSGSGSSTSLYSEDQ